ncbi:MBL fold metallo-hydrolase [bacterium]|nr:MBL fold metallo-hydrolase [candidate division CSSED10-310 bacterium]
MDQNKLINRKDTIANESILPVTDSPFQGTIKISILYDNYQVASDTQAAWGFSCLVAGFSNTLMFDTGGDGEILGRNMEIMHKHRVTLDSVVISHNHWDHVGGWHYVRSHLSPHILYLPFEPNAELKNETESHGVVIKYHQNPVKICDHVYLSGTIGDDPPEQSLILNTQNGLVIITGCAHPGILTIIDRIKTLFTSEIRLIIGGFHLKSCHEEELRAIATQMKIRGVLACGPTHCSGDLTRNIFHDQFKNNYFSLGTGVELWLSPNQLSMNI